MCKRCGGKDVLVYRTTVFTVYICLDCGFRSIR